MFSKVVLNLILINVVLSNEVKTYKGFKIYEISPKTDLEINVLKEMASNVDYDFFFLPKLIEEAPAKVMIDPKDQLKFENALTVHGINYTIMTNDVEAINRAERTQNNFMRSLTLNEFGFLSYHRYDEINAYLAELAMNYPNRVSVKIVGKSYEGRDIKAIVIKNGDGRINKKAIFVDAGIHAREWIAPAGALFMIYELIQNFDYHKNLLEKFDWIILPLANPDGYEYSHTTDRMWRKTRKPVEGNCVGTDINRNFNSHWGSDGSPNFPCSNTYTGDSPFSEPETRVIANIMKSMSGRGLVYLSLHSFGKKILYPWGWTSSLPDNWADVQEIAEAGAAAILKTTGQFYIVGSPSKILYNAAGGSLDYALEKAKIPISIAIEMASAGRIFHPLPSDILPIVQETWIGVQAIIRTTMNKY